MYLFNLTLGKDVCITLPIGSHWFNDFLVLQKHYDLVKGYSCLIMLIKISIVAVFWCHPRNQSIMLKIMLGKRYYAPNMLD